METSIDLAMLLEAREAASSGRGMRVRIAAGISQGELAAAVGVTAACISRWEAGDRRPRGEAAARYAQTLRELAERVIAA
jgi:DNA-binding transcriptional regulator YiaG